MQITSGELEVNDYATAQCCPYKNRRDPVCPRVSRSLPPSGKVLTNWKLYASRTLTISSTRPNSTHKPSPHRSPQFHATQRSAKTPCLINDHARLNQQASWLCDKHKPSTHPPELTSPSPLHGDIVPLQPAHPCDASLIGLTRHFLATSQQ